MSRDDAVVRLQGRRKEEPRREPVPVTGPPAGRRTRHTAPYRPLLSHSLPPPLYALRPSRPAVCMYVCAFARVCVYVLPSCEPRIALLATGDSRCLQVLQTMSTRAGTALIMLPAPATMFTARELCAIPCLPCLPSPLHAPYPVGCRLPTGDAFSHADFAYDDGSPSRVCIRSRAMIDTQVQRHET